MEAPWPQIEKTLKDCPVSLPQNRLRCYNCITVQPFPLPTPVFFTALQVLFLRGLSNKLLVCKSLSCVRNTDISSIGFLGLL